MTKNTTKQDLDFSKKSNLVEPFTLVSCLFIACFVYLNHLALFFHGFPWFKLIYAASSPPSDVDQRLGFLDKCDVYDGRWVWDENYPLYQSQHCPFIDSGFRCLENGRPDGFYTKWRWQPKACNLPRFNATKMLEKLRNRRIAFVGDSIGRNQWESLLCMLSSAIPNKDSIYEVNGSPITKHKGFLVFRFADYNCTVEYYRVPFLVAHGSPPRGAPEAVKMTLRLDLMDRTWHRWVGADVLVFNTGHWWSHHKTTNRGCYFQQGTEVNLNMNITTAFRESIETLLNFVHGQVNTNKTQIYFRTYAPEHFRRGSWNTGGHCHHIKFPDFGLYPDKTEEHVEILSRVLSKKHPQVIEMMNVTPMTFTRQDGHTSLYHFGRENETEPPGEDCSHWCLPGVPDSWNELLYSLFLKWESLHSTPISLLD